MEEFIFNKITQDDMKEYEKEANVFNFTFADLQKEKILLNNFYDKIYGNSKTKIDIAIKKDAEWKLLDIEDKLQYEEVTLGYLLENMEYTKVLVIERTMSTMIIDKIKAKSNAFIYNVLPKKYENLKIDSATNGMVAKNQVILDGTSEMYAKIETLDDYSKTRIKEILNEVE